MRQLVKPLLETPASHDSENHIPPVPLDVQLRASTFEADQSSNAWAFDTHTVGPDEALDSGLALSPILDSYKQL